MTQKIVETAYAKLDAAHFMDGLFVPTRGKKRERLFVAPKIINNIEVSFQGFEQLGDDDQSILYALSGQLGLNGLFINKEPPAENGAQLRLALEFNEDDGGRVAVKSTTLRSLLIDAGYPPNKSTNFVKDCLNRLANSQIREFDLDSGWDRRCNLISVIFNRKTNAILVAANPRLTYAIFATKNQHHIRLSLFERSALDSSVAKILHAWLCSCIHPGQSIGFGNGIHIDKLGPHIWGGEWEKSSISAKSRKRNLIREALDEILEKTRHLHSEGDRTKIDAGWAIEQKTNGVVFISRPLKMPVWGLTPSEMDALKPPRSKDYEPL